MPLPIRHTASLRRGRISIPSTRYFLTLCTRNRESVLTDPLNAERIIATWLELEASGDLKLLAVTLMPDHLHALFVLDDRLPLSRVMSKYKTLSKDQSRTSWRWQQNGFEHRLRENEDPSDYAFHIFMTPYRAKLIKPSERWPWQGATLHKPRSICVHQRINVGIRLTEGNKGNKDMGHRGPKINPWFKIQPSACSSRDLTR